MYALLILCYLVTSCISILRVLYSNTNAHAYVLAAPCVCAHYRYAKKAAARSFAWLQLLIHRTFRLRSTLMKA